MRFSLLYRKPSRFSGSVPADSGGSPRGAPGEQEGGARAADGAGIPGGVPRHRLPGRIRVYLGQAGQRGKTTVNLHKFCTLESSSFVFVSQSGSYSMNMMCPGSPPPSTGSGGGTIV